jgi:GT2 family glycosyltransferase
MAQVSPVCIDIIILSYARDESLKDLTNATIQSLIDSENPSEIRFNVVVIESNSSLEPYQFSHSKTIYPSEKFGFHKYLNIGIKATSSDYICLCNNDLIFHSGWASAILNEMGKDPELLSANPYCPLTHSINGIVDDGKNNYSTQNGILIGWCIFLKRTVIDAIGYLDENMEFWYSDNDYGNSLKKHQIKHALVTSSKVTHIGSQTHHTLSKKELFDFSYAQFIYYDFKWNHHNQIVYSLKKSLLPVFYFLMDRRKRNSIYDISARLVSKFYGGIKT